MAEPPATTPAAASTEREVLLATKLHIPRTRPGFVVRPRLADRLTEADPAQLTLVCAPAGFGKTALLADWTRRSQGGRGRLSHRCPPSCRSGDDECSGGSL